MLTLNLPICHGCELRQRPCAGACACTITGKDIIEHAKRDFCRHPDGPKFGTATPPPDWLKVPRVVGRSPAEIEAMLDAQQYTKADLHKGGCNCGGNDLLDSP